MAEYVQIIFKYFSEIPASLFDFGTMLVAAVSAICAFLAYKTQRARAKKASACELAKYYADNIINRSAYIGSVYSNCKYTEQVKSTFPLDKISSFTRHEMEELLKQSEISEDEMHKAAFNVDPCIIGASKTIYCGINNVFDFLKIDLDPKDDGEVSGSGLLLQAEFHTSLNTQLNELEWFSMQCRYGVADEGLLYQSLHQTFLSDVQMLYFHISSRNTNSEDKLFTNTIWLFKIWKARLEKFKKKNEAAIVRANRKLKKAQEEAKRAGRSVHHGKAI